MFFYCLTFLWVHQHLSSSRLFIKYHLVWSFASLPLFSPLNCRIPVHVISCATSGSAFPCSLGLAFESAGKSLQCITPSITAELSLGQGWIYLGAGWHWLHQSLGKLLPASPRSHPCPLLCYQTLPQNPIHPLFALFHQCDASIFGYQWFILTVKADCVNFCCISDQWSFSISAQPLNVCCLYCICGIYHYFATNIHNFVFCSSMFTLKSYRIGLRIKKLSKHPCPEATLPGMNNKWIVFQSKRISWHELL